MMTNSFRCNPYQTMAEDALAKSLSFAVKAALSGYYGYYNDAIGWLNFVHRLCKNEDLALPDGFEAVADSLTELEKLL